jgi:hypothetical protein
MARKVHSAPSQRCDPAEAARLYIADEAFAERFDAELRDEHARQLQRLSRVARHLQGTDRAGDPGTTLATNQIRVDPDDHMLRRVEAAARAARKQGVTRGDLASAIGVDNRDGRLTRALVILKREGALVQRGERRSARYFASDRS